MESSSDKPLQLKIADFSNATVDPNNIWKDDLMGRDEVACHLENVLIGQDGPLTCCLDSEWGMGKTFFLQRLRCQWQKNGGRALFFNAWEDDFLSDQLVALAGQIWDLIKSGTLSEVCNDIKINAGEFIKNVVQNKFGFDLKNLKTGTKDAFDEYLSLGKYRSDLRARLGEVAQSVYKETNRPLLFIIDELDRCRPTFAVELLERVKHIFSVEHIVFLIGIDCNQLKQSIHSIYGDIDADNYLHRFIDVTFTLPEVDMRHYFHSLCVRHNVNGRLKTIGCNVDYNVFSEAFCSLMVHYKMSFREVEICLRQFTLLAFSNSTRVASYVIFVGIAIALRMKNQEAYRHFIAWDIPVGELVDMIYGDLADKVSLSPDLPCLQFILYLYKYAWFGDVGSVQSNEINRLFELVGKDDSTQLDSPYIAKCFRNHYVGDLRRCIACMEQWRKRNDFKGFRSILTEINKFLDCITDIRL